MASAWAEVRRDTVARVEAVAPTYDSRTLWRHVGIERTLLPEDSETGRTREFRDSWQTDQTEPVAITGAHEQQQARVLRLRTYYLVGDDVDEYVGTDEDDLISALAPSSTYPSGAWGDLRVREVQTPAEVDTLGDGVVAVTWSVRVVYRRPVTVR